jgi:hypothetical protein
MVNAVIIMISAISIASALDVAGSTILTEDKVLAIQIFQTIISNAWSIGGFFFGLWLLPMGYIIIKSKRMPLWLGRVILLGGIGYLISTVLSYIGIDFSYSSILTIPATIGEFWMIGYLFIFGIRPANE